MLKAKATIEIEFDKDETPPDWQESLKVFFTTNLSGAMVYFSESKAVMKVKKVKIEKSNNK